MYNERIRKRFNTKALIELTAHGQDGYRLLREPQFEHLRLLWELELEDLFDTLKKADDPRKIAVIQGQISIYEKLFKSIDQCS